MGMVYNEEKREEVQSEKDKDLIIAELLAELADKEQRVSDVEMIVAELMVNGGVN